METKNLASSTTENAGEETSTLKLSSPIVLKPNGGRYSMAKKTPLSKVEVKVDLGERIKYTFKI
jgi:hypothetical protein